MNAEAQHDDEKLNIPSICYLQFTRCF